MFKTDKLIKVYIVNILPRQVHYRTGFYELSRFFNKFHETELLSKRLGSVSDNDINRLILAELEYAFNGDKKWNMNRRVHEKVLEEIYPEINLSEIKNGEKVYPYTEVFNEVMERTDSDLKLSESIIDQIKTIDTPWTVWEIKSLNKDDTVAVTNIGDYRILEWIRLVNDGVIEFGNKSNNQYLDSEISEVRKVCER